MAGNTRFHSKYHFAQHHSEVTNKNTQFPDAATDPVASQGLPFQGDFYSDGVLKIHSMDADKFNYFGNDVQIDSNLLVTQNTEILGDLTVIGNVTLKANPKLAEPQVIKIGDDKDGSGNTVDKVRFVAYVDSDLSPDDSEAHNLGEYHKRWWWLYATNISLDGEFKIGTCSKDAEEAEDRGLYVNLRDHIGAKARVGINTCSPTNELSVVGRTDITETLTLTGNAFFHSNLILDGNADIDGDIILLDDNIIYWNNKDVAITADQQSMNVRHPILLDVDAPRIDISTYSVDLNLKDAVDALDIADCLMMFDTINRRVGINTCSPIDNFDVRGSMNLEGNHVNIKVDDSVSIDADGDIKTVSENVDVYTRDEIKQVANQDIILTSEEKDIEMRAENGAINVLVKDFGIAVQNEFSISSGVKIKLAAPDIETASQRLLMNSDVSITTSTTDRFDTASNNHTITIQNDQIINVTRDRIASIGRDDKLTVGRDMITNVTRDQKTTVTNDRIDHILHDDTLTVDNIRTTHIKNNDITTVDNNRTTDIIKDDNLTVHQDKFDHIARNETRTIDNNQSIGVGVDQTTIVGNDQTITVQNISTENVLVDKIVNVTRNYTDNVGGDKLTDVEDVYTINSANFTSINEGNLGLNLTDPEYRLSIPCGDEIGTASKNADGDITGNSFIEFCSTTDNDAGDRNMTLFNDNQSDIVFDPGRSVVVPSNNVGIGKVPAAEYAFEVLGESHFIGRVISDTGFIDTTLNDNQVIYKDDITKAHTTTMEFYYDGIRAAIGHIPSESENAMLYVAKGPIRLESRVNNILTLDSSRTLDFSAIGESHKSNSAVFESPIDHNMVIDLRNNTENTAFVVRNSAFNQDTGLYSGAADTIALMVRPESSRSKAFFGFNTTRNIREDTDSSGINHNYDAVFNAHMDITGDLHIGDDLHVEDNGMIDGKLTINSENETTGLEVRTGRIDLVERLNNVDHRFEIGSHTNLLTKSSAEIPGSATGNGSTISNATNDHFVLDLRNTSEDHRFAIRYSSDNTGIADKLLLTGGHYVYDIANPDFDDTQPPSSSNPPTIKDPLQGHVGINCIPTPGYHLDVNGTMRITGDFVVEGDETTIRVGNVTVEDKNIILNIVPDGISDTSLTFDAGVLIQGDNNEIVGYWKVHPIEVDKLVAKAPTGVELMLDVNGSVTSNIILEDTNITSNLSTTTLQNTTINSLSGNVEMISVDSVARYADVLIDTNDQSKRIALTFEYTGNSDPVTAAPAFDTYNSVVDSELDLLRSSLKLLNTTVNYSNSVSQSSDSTIVHDSSTDTLTNSTNTLTNSTSILTNSTNTLDNSTLTAGNSTITFGNGCTFTVETGSTSIINQDLTSDSTEATFSQLVLTDSLTVPVGNDKGLPQDGNIRYNSTTGEYEGYVVNNGDILTGVGNWVPFNRVSDEDGDTYIQPQTNANTDEDRFDFYVDGTRVGYISSTEFNFNVPIINNATSALKVPVGNTLDRPTCTATGVTDPCTGLVRYNTDLISFEGYNGNNWTTIGGLIDVDRDTYILPESAPQADEDQLTFYCANQNVVTMSQSAVAVYKTTTVPTAGTTRVRVGGPTRKTFTSADVSTLTPTSGQSATGMTSTNKYLVFDHNCNETYPIVQIYDNSKRMIIPDEVHLSSANQVCVDLTSYGTITGTWCVVVYV